jgi:hypothetical protein
MSAVPHDSATALPSAVALGAGSGISRAEVSTRLGLRPLVAILTAFWIYVMLSNLLYAREMQISLSAMSSAHLFASWDARVVQHLVLYPVLIGCTLLSLRVGWQPAWRAWPIQVLLGVTFSALASPVLMLGELVSGDKPWQSHAMPHTMGAFWKGPEPSMWLSSVTSFLITYGFALALVTGFNLYHRFRDSQLRVAALERAWSAAHLATLRMQLSPHTLFNLLHTIRGQITWDPRAAQAMVVQLADLLRRLLTAGERDFSRLSDELHFVHSYLELQKQRFADRLTLRFPEVEVLPALWVPSLILQPLVENAVVHGLAGHEGPVVIRVELEAGDKELLIRVTNTVAPDKPIGREGIGLRNVRERLAVQFGEKASFSAGPGDGGEWIATLRMPLLRDGPTVSQLAQRGPAS